jgi:hypothetical protein
MRCLKSRNNGAVWEWNKILAENPACFELTEEEAFPERFIRPAQIEAAIAKRNGRPPLNLYTEEVQEPCVTSPELSADASRNLGQKGGITLTPPGVV